MSSFLGWQQKWGVAGLKLTWADAWTEGFLLGDVTLNMKGYGGLSPSGFGYKIAYPIGDVTLPMIGRPSVSGNATMLIPGDFILGNLNLTLSGKMTVAGGPFNTVDPWWIDPPNQLSLSGHLGFPNVVTIAKVLAFNLGAVTLQMNGHMGLPQSQSIGKFIRKDLGAVGLDMIGGMDVYGSVTARTGAAHPLGDVTLALVGRSTLSSVNLVAQLPPHELGDVTLPMFGAMTVDTLRLFSGGPITIGALSLNMGAKLGLSGNFAYPPFDTGSEIHGVVDPSVTTIKATVEPDSLESQ